MPSPGFGAFITRRRSSFLLAVIAVASGLLGCVGLQSSGTGNPSKVVAPTTTAPAVQINATPATIHTGQLSTISWTTQNATSIAFIPDISDGEGPPPVSSGILTVGPLQTTTYVATASGPGGSATASVTVTVQPLAPTITFSSTPSFILATQSAVLHWATSNATQVSIDNGVGAVQSVGSTQVSPGSTTTYTLTATGPGGTQTAQTTINVAPAGTLAITLTASPLSVAAGKTTTITWQSQNATSVNIEPSPGANQALSGSAAVSLKQTTTFTATATDASGNTSSATVQVAVISPGDLSKIKHVIFYLQENRSFDMYFGKLGAYRASRGIGPASDLDSFDPQVTLKGFEGIMRSPFHERTVRTDEVAPSWKVDHDDLDRPGETFADSNSQCSGPPTPLCSAGPGSNCKMDHFMFPNVAGTSVRDPNNDRTIGYYDQTDLPYYYELAAQFATSDRWFSPVLASTIPNRMYIFAGTSFGHVVDDPVPAGGWQQPTIFDELDAAGISWTYYHIDSNVFLAEWGNWAKHQPHVQDISSWYQALAQPNADELLPQVVFIERGGTDGLDEHPQNNIQFGAANAANIVNALLNSPAWASSAFLFTYDEGGGLYDHVPPFPETKPDAIQPILRPTYPCAGFNESGFRIPLIVISPWTRPHFVSHVNRDHTAILKFIETRFGLPALTARDAAQDDMLEFFDFSSPQLLNPPVLPQQPINGTDNRNMEAAP